MLVLKGTKRPVKSVCFSPDGTLLASGAAEGGVRIWNALDGALLAVLTEPEGASPTEEFDVLFAPDNRHLVVTSMRFKITIWDVGTQKLIQRLIPRSNVMVEPCTAFAPDGRLLALRWDVASGLFAWNPTTWEKLPVLWEPGPGEQSSTMALEPGGQRAALESGLLLDINNGAVLGRWGERVNAYWARGRSTFVWCPQKPLLAFRSAGNAIDVVNPDDAQLVARVTTSTKKHIEAFTFTPNGHYLIAVSNDRVARMYDTDTWTERQTLDWGIGGLRSVAVAPDGSRAAAGSAVSTYSGKIVIWDLD